MAYDIKISGHNELLRIEDGYMLCERWKRYKKKEIPDEGVEVGNFVGSLSDIKSFRKISDVKSDNKLADEVYKNYVKSLKEFRALPITERAKSMGFFRLVYWGFTQQHSEKLKTSEGIPIEKLAEGIQRQFYEENPKRMLCDTHLFKPIIKSKKCESSVMRIIETHIRQDVFAEKNIN